MKVMNNVILCVGVIVASLGCKNGGFIPGSSDKSDEKSARTDDQTVVNAPQVPEQKNILELAVTDHDMVEFNELSEGEEQMKKVCEAQKGKTNLLIQKFCVENFRPKNLMELYQALNLDPTGITTRNQNGANGSPAFAFQGHSSSLVKRMVSSINPRIVIFNSQTPGQAADSPDFIAMGFVRGEQFAEVLVTNDSSASNPDLFLVAFKQACNAKPEGCNYADLQTEAIEKDWTEVTLYHQDDLKNTIIDCLRCHQPEGPGTPIFARQQELRNPWTHWIRDNTAGDEIYNDFIAAHGTEGTYAGVPHTALRASDPANLQDLIEGSTSAGSSTFNVLQVREVQFQTSTIQNEIEASSTSNQPIDNTDPGESATWENLYQIAMTGKAADGSNVIHLPYHNVKVTEPSLLAKYSKQIQDYKAGMIKPEDFESHLDIFKTDHKQRADMGFRVRMGTPPEQMLIQACVECHNSKLDQSQSRAKFNVDLAAMGAEAAKEIDIAIERLKLGYSPERLKKDGVQFYDPKTNKVKEMHKGEHILTMPPRKFVSLTDDQIDQLIQYLETEKLKFK